MCKHNTGQNMNTHQLSEKGLDIVELLLGDELQEEFGISCHNGVCKIRVPTSVSLAPIQNEPLVKAIEFKDVYTIITISEHEIEDGKKFCRCDGHRCCQEEVE